MAYKRDPNLPLLIRDWNHPATKISGFVFAFLFMPFLNVIAWMKASEFDPYTMSFFTKTYVEPTLSMPDEMRIAGWVFVGIGALLVFACVNGLAKARVRFREIAIVLWISFSIALFGGAFFVAADSAAAKIEQEMRVETGQT